jgi:hypothetical protein
VRHGEPADGAVVREVVRVDLVAERAHADLLAPRDPVRGRVDVQRHRLAVGSRERDDLLAPAPAADAPR